MEKENPGAVGTGRDIDAEALRRLELPKDIPAVTVCALGRTSRIAADILAQSGFRAFSLWGGMQAWSLAWNLAAIPLPLSLPDAGSIQVRRAGKGCLSYLLFSRGEAAVFAGDTLFLDSVGRPDLIVGADPRRPSELPDASLRRLAALPDAHWVLPAHVAAPPAFDGKPLAAALGQVKAGNRFLAASETEFQELPASGRNSPPPNFGIIAEADRSGVLPEGDWAALEAGPNRCARA